MANPYEAPENLESNRATLVSLIRYGSGVAMIVIGGFFTVWGCVSFVVSLPKAMELGTMKDYIKYLGSCMVFSTFGIVSCLAGWRAFRNKMGQSFFVFGCAFAILIVGSLALVPFIDIPAP